MTTDRTTKSLLFFIAVALWGLLLHSVFAPARTAAQIGPVPPVRIEGIDGNLPVTVQRSAVIEIKAAPGTTLPVEVQK